MGETKRQKKERIADLSLLATFLNVRGHAIGMKPMLQETAEKDGTLVLNVTHDSRPTEAQGVQLVSGLNLPGIDFKYASMLMFAAAPHILSTYPDVTSPLAIKIKPKDLPNVNAEIRKLVGLAMTDLQAEKALQTLDAV